MTSAQEVTHKDASTFDPAHMFDGYTCGCRWDGEMAHHCVPHWIAKCEFVWLHSPAHAECCDLPHFQKIAQEFGAEAIQGAIDTLNDGNLKTYAMSLLGRIRGDG